MRIDTSGNVGIGNSSPARKLEVTAIPATVNQLNGIRVAMSGTPTSIAEFLLGTSAGGVPFTSIRTGNDGNSWMEFLTGSGPTERMRVFASGGVSIGNTTDRGAGNLNVTGVVLTGGYTVATLPAGVVGMRAYVTDALAPSFGVAVAGSGAVTIPVFYNGANWIVA
jgi:hypothetical protein